MIINKRLFLIINSNNILCNNYKVFEIIKILIYYILSKTIITLIILLLLLSYIKLLFLNYILFLTI